MKSILIFGVLIFSSLGLARGSKFTGLVDGYFNGYFYHNPTSATAAGFHQYDHQLEDYSRAEVERLVEFNQQWLTKISAFTDKEMTPDDLADKELLVNSLKAS